MRARVAPNGADFAPSAAAFFYYAAPQALSASPPSGSDAGGTLVTVRGRNFSPALDAAAAARGEALAGGLACVFRLFAADAARFDAADRKSVV